MPLYSLSSRMNHPAELNVTERYRIILKLCNYNNMVFKLLVPKYTTGYGLFLATKREEKKIYERQIV